MSAAPNTQRAIGALAADAIRLGTDGRLPTSLEYQQALGVGAGTVQQALRMLEDSGALEVVARGHMGRHIAALDVGSLWSLGHFPPVRFLLPAPGAIELYAFTDALLDHFAQLGVPCVVTYQRGGRSRVDALRAGEADATLLSCGAAAGLVGGDADALVSRNLGVDTYYAEDTVVVVGAPGARERPPRGLRVGIDPESFDQPQLTQAEFPAEWGVEYVPCDFPSMPVAVLDGRVDAGIWRRLELLISPERAGVEVTMLREPATIALRRELSAAVVVAATRRPAAAALCEQLDGEAVRVRQQELAALDPDELTRRYWLR